MKRIRINYAIILLLIVLSAVFFILQLVLFHNVEESGFLFFQDMMLPPLHILLVFCSTGYSVRGKNGSGLNRSISSSARSLAKQVPMH